jgi:lipopolysaccharide O-acetyltransferase
VIACSRGDLSVGRNSIIGANSVVTKSIPSFSVVVGNPARIVSQYDPQAGEWKRLRP